jgi:hypothetical protein
LKAPDCVHKTENTLVGLAAGGLLSKLLVRKQLIYMQDNVGISNRNTFLLLHLVFFVLQYVALSLFSQYAAYYMYYHTIHCILLPRNSLHSNFKINKYTYMYAYISYPDICI